MRNWRASIVVLLLASLVGARTVAADEILRVEGDIVKWPPIASGLGTVITYAALTGPYSLPSDRNTLSPDNCGVMRPFAEIVSTSVDVSEETARRELRSAFAAWADVAGIRFAEVTDLDQANIIIGATNASTGRAFANLSVAGSPRSQTAAKLLGGSSDDRPEDFARPDKGGRVAAIERAYVCLNLKMPWKVGFDGNLNVYDLRYTLMHEIGHAIGLDHPGSSGSVMGYRYDERVRQLQTSDIAAAQRLYGPPAAK